MWDRRGMDPEDRETASRQTAKAAGHEEGRQPMKIGVLLPGENKLDIARKVIEEVKAEVVYLKDIQSYDAVNEARRAIEAGAEILVARGYQAMLIRRFTNIPLVEMRIHTAELGLLLNRAREIARKEKPCIGLIAFANMMPDLTYMEELFHIRLVTRVIERTEEGESVLREMEEDRPDVIIAGPIICLAAEQMGYPAIRFTSTEESIRTALQEAIQMGNALERDMANTAQIEAFLDTSSNGIIRINKEGSILLINKVTEDLVGQKSDKVVGQPLEAILPMLDPGLPRQVLEGKREDVSTSITLQGRAWMVLIVPVRYDNHITGAVLSMRGLSSSSASSQKARRELIRNGFTAVATFAELTTRNEYMKEILNEARSIALSDSPVLLYSEPGTEIPELAEAIHNNSVRRAAPFISMTLEDLSAEEQMQALFGRRDPDDPESPPPGAMFRADHGTLMVYGIDHMCVKVQLELLRVLMDPADARSFYESLNTLDVRIIGTAASDLRGEVRAGRFSRELFYMLQGCSLRIPPLRDRPEDLEEIFDRYFRAYTRQYSRPLTLTEGGRKQILKFKWPGNRIQVKGFCERLALSSRKRSVDEVALRKLYDLLYPDLRDEGGKSRVVVYRSQEAEELSVILRKHNGNRAEAARELGISTTTLWRRMKKYGIEASF